MNLPTQTDNLMRTSFTLFFKLKADDEDAFFNHINQFTEADKKLAFEYNDVCLASDYNAEPELESKLEFFNLFKV